MKNSIFENTNSSEWKVLTVWVFIIDCSKAVRDTFLHSAQFKCRHYLDRRRRVRVHHIMLVVCLCLDIALFQIFNGLLRTKARVGIWEIRMNLFFFTLFLGSLVLWKLRPKSLVLLIQFSYLILKLLAFGLELLSRFEMAMAASLIFKLSQVFKLLLNLLVLCRDLIFEICNQFLWFCAFIADSFDHFFLRILYLISKLREVILNGLCTWSKQIEQLGKLFWYGSADSSDNFLLEFREHRTHPQLAWIERSQLGLHLGYVFNNIAQLIIILLVAHRHKFVVLNDFVDYCLEWDQRFCRKRLHNLGWHVSLIYLLEPYWKSLKVTG